MKYTHTAKVKSVENLFGTLCGHDVHVTPWGRLKVKGKVPLAPGMIELAGTDLCVYQDGKRYWCYKWIWEPDWLEDIQKIEPDWDNDIDWARVPLGTHVYVRDEDRQDWRPLHWRGLSANDVNGKFKASFESLWTCPPGQHTSAPWKQCKLANAKDILKYSKEGS